MEQHIKVWQDAHLSFQSLPLNRLASIIVSVSIFLLFPLLLVVETFFCKNLTFGTPVKNLMGAISFGIVYGIWGSVIFVYASAFLSILGWVPTPFLF